jgi:hypothetical protein
LQKAKAVALQTCNDGCNRHAAHDRQSRIAPKSDQDAGGHTRSRPEQGNAIGFAA